MHINAFAPGKFIRRRSTRTLAAATETDPGRVLLVRSFVSARAEGSSVCRRHRDSIFRASPHLRDVFFILQGHFSFSSLINHGLPGCQFTNITHDAFYAVVAENILGYMNIYEHRGFYK
jgi:hypothetical protein